MSRNKIIKAGITNEDLSKESPQINININTINNNDSQQENGDC